MAVQARASRRARRVELGGHGQQGGRWSGTGWAVTGVRLSGEEGFDGAVAVLGLGIEDEDVLVGAGED